MDPKSILIEVGWKKASRSLGSSCAGAGKDPFAKAKDAITDPINKLQPKAPSEDRRLDPSSNSRREATGAARNEQLGGAQDLLQGLAMGYDDFYLRLF